MINNDKFNKVIIFHNQVLISKIIKYNDNLIFQYKKITYTDKFNKLAEFHNQILTNKIKNSTMIL